MTNINYKTKFHNEIIKPCQDVLNFIKGLKSGTKALSEIHVYNVNSHFTNQIKQATPYKSYIGKFTEIYEVEEIGDSHTNNHKPDSICSILYKLDISCKYEIGSNTKLFIDGISITAIAEKTMIKALSDSKKCLISYDTLKCIDSAFDRATDSQAPSQYNGTIQKECQDTYNITQTLGNKYIKFLADANVARAQYLDSCPAHDMLDSSDMLLDSSNIAEEWLSPSVDALAEIGFASSSEGFWFL